MASDPREGTIGVWSKYYDQANPLVIFKGDEWVELTLADVVAEFNALPLPEIAPRPMPGIN